MVDSLAVILMLTLPNANASMAWIPPSQRDVFEDSMAVVCDQPGAPLGDLDSLVVFGYPSTGGGWRRVRAEGMRGREGQRDTLRFTLPWSGGNFYIATTDTAGNLSCASNQAYVGTVTAVPVPEVVHAEDKIEWYDVHGRRMRDLRGTGIRFRVTRREGRIIERRKVVFFKGRPLVHLPGL